MVETEELRRSQPCLGYAEAQPALAAKQQQGYAPALSPLAASHLTRSDTYFGEVQDNGKAGLTEDRLRFRSR